MEQLSAQLSHIAEYILLLAPEMLLAAGFVLCILADILFPKAPASWPAVLVALLALAGAAYCLYAPPLDWQPQVVLEGMILADTFAWYFRVLIILSGFLALGQWLIAKEHSGRGEQLALFLAALLGAEMMVLAGDFLLLYLGIELVSVSAYILMIFRFTPKASAAAIKYLLFGALSSGLMLYGISFLYGLSGSLSFVQEGFVAQLAEAEPLLVFLALILVLAGLLFKVSAVPFHVWSPEVYQHAPTQWLGFFSVVPKIAGMAVLWRFSQVFQDFTFKPVEGWDFSWAALLALLAVASILVGNLAALSQQNAKALMAFSGIAQSGFMLILVALGTSFGLQSLRAYLGVYMLMNFLAFVLIQIVEEQEGAELRQYAGLGKSHPFLGILFLMAMLSLVGLPPLAGFTAKLLLFSALWEGYGLQQEAFWLWLFVIGLLNTAVGLFYYLKIPYYFFFGQSEKNATFRLSKPQYLYAMALALLLLVFFAKIDAWWF